MGTVQVSPFAFDVGLSQRLWDDIIDKYGDLALLRQRGLPDRYVSVVSATFSPMERLGGISNPVDRKALVSAISPETDMPLDPEPSEKDVLVTIQLNADGSPMLDASGKPMEEERLKIVAPPGRVGPSRQTLFWRLQVRA